MLSAELVAAALAQALPAGEALRPPFDVSRLTGGYSWQTHLVRDAADRAVVLRVAPAGGTLDPYDPEVERRALAAAAAVPAPRVLAVAGPDNPLGAAFSVQTLAPGQVLALRDVDDPSERRAYRRAFAETLGRLHARGDVSALGPVPATLTEALDAELERTAAHLVRSVPYAHPGVEIGLRWLRTHRPAGDGSPVVCHGDYRFHNLTWTAPGALGAVLDWERAWAGDPMVDIAFTRRFSGWCAIDDGEACSWYADEAGIDVDEDRVAYGLRLEQVRSYSSSFRGVRALADGRSEALALYGVGEAGDTGAWELCDWLAEGPLLPLSETWRSPLHWQPLVPVARRTELLERARAAGDERLATHLATVEETDRAARAASLEALREVGGEIGPIATALQGALGLSDDEQAWAAAHAVLAETARIGGPELVPALRALGLRATAGATLRPTTMGGRR